MEMAAEKKLMSISEVNALPYETFISLLGNVVEHCSLCAAAVCSARPFKDIAELQTQFEHFLDELPQNGKEGVLRLYPDLAGRLAKQGGLTQESVREHASAGLDSLTEEEQQKMSELNGKYKKKFGFPFVVCARENKKDAILKGLEKRLENTSAAEAQTAVNEVKKICSLRIKDLVCDH